MNYHHPGIKFLRSLARRTGLLEIVRRYVHRQDAAYEEPFARALMGAIVPGSVIWDIGANVGLYTRQFLEWTGPQGKVVAFEPYSKAFAALQSEMQRHPCKDSWEIHQLALSDCPGEMFLAVDDASPEAVSTTASLGAMPASGNTGELVRVSTVDAAVKELGIVAPQVTKIDVEGFEEEVLQGGSAVFSSRESKHLLIEVHFRQLEDRCSGNVPARLVSMLRDWGYRVEWVDSSHLHAFRPPQ